MLGLTKIVECAIIDILVFGQLNTREEKMSISGTSGTSHETISYEIDVRAFVDYMKKGAKLLRNLSSDEGYGAIIEYAERILFRQALRGDEISHDALNLLNPQQSEQISTVLDTYDTALNIFEDAAPDLVGSIPAEVTQKTVKRLFFALLGIDHGEAAFQLIEHMWQVFSWKYPQKKIPAASFNTVFSVLMAGGSREDAMRLLADTEPYVDWNDSCLQPTTVEAVMGIFSVFFSLGKYALCKRVISAIKPHIDYESFLDQLEADAEEEKSEAGKEEGAEIVLEEPKKTEDTSLEEALEAIDTPEIQPEIQDAPCVTDQQSQREESVSPPKVAASPTPARELIETLEESFTSLMAQYPPNQNFSEPEEFRFSFHLPIWDTDGSPVGTLTRLNGNLHEMLMTLVRMEGVKCLQDIPLTVAEFQTKFPRFSDEKYQRKITVIARKVKGTLENTKLYQKTNPTIFKGAPTLPFPLEKQEGKKAIR